MQPILLIDGNHLARRSYFTVGKTLRTTTGKASGVIYGTANSLRKIALKFNDCRMLVFFDGGHEEATKLFEGYKNNPGRNRDDDFYEQCAVLTQLVGWMGVRTIRIDGVEADTLIGVAAYGYSRTSDVIIVSSDHDMYQLLSKRVEVYDDLKNKKVTDTDLSQYYTGFMPKDMIGLKALMGDRSDNIPGLPGMGEGTALEVLRQLDGYKGVRALTRRGCPMPDPEDFPSKMRFRIEKAFAKPKEVRTVLKRNLRLVKIPTRVHKLPMEIQKEYLTQIGRQPSVQMRKIQRVLEQYQINSILGRVEMWIKPLVAAGRL